LTYKESLQKSAWLTFCKENLHGDIIMILNYFKGSTEKEIRKNSMDLLGRENL